MKKQKRTQDKESNDGILIESPRRRSWLEALFLIVGAMSINLPSYSMDINMQVQITVHPWWIVPFIFSPEGV